MHRAYRDPAEKGFEKWLKFCQTISSHTMSKRSNPGGSGLTPTRADSKATRPVRLLQIYDFSASFPSILPPAIHYRQSVVPGASTMMLPESSLPTPHTQTGKQSRAKPVQEASYVLLEATFFYWPYSESRS